MSDNILLITDDNLIAKLIVDKLILLRKTDKISTCEYDNALKSINIYKPKVIILHENALLSETIDMLKDLNHLEKREQFSIVLLVNNYDKDFVLDAYDEGIDECFSVKAEPYEMLIRTINAFKIINKKVDNNRKTKLLQQQGVMCECKNLYSRKFAKQVFENETDISLKQGFFIALSHDEVSKSGYNEEKMMDALNSSIREKDLIFHGPGSKFYIVMADTEINGAIAVINKLKEYLKSDFSIKAGLCDMKNMTFSKIEKRVLAALSEAMLSKDDYIVLEEKEETLDEWLYTEVKSVDKDYKLFKNAFNKKLENIIAPVFFRLQKTYEEKLSKTKIEQFTDEIQSVFHLKNKKQDSKLKIVYPGFAKIIISITHSGLDSPENREITLPLNLITQKEIVSVVESFIHEFKEMSEK